MIMHVSKANVDEMSERVRSFSSCAIYSATLFLSPLPSPISMLSIHKSKLLMVSQTPFVYSPKQFRVTGTMRSTMRADHPLTKKDAMTFFWSREERFWLMLFSAVMVLGLVGI